MIATRLHAKRLSSSTLNRPSLTSIHSTAIHHTYQQQRKLSRRPSADIRNIDSDNNDDDTDDDNNNNNNRIHESTKVENISLTLLIIK